MLPAGTILTTDGWRAQCGKPIPIGALLMDSRVDVMFYERDPEAAFQRLKDFKQADFKGSLKARDRWHVVFEAPANENALVAKLPHIMRKTAIGIQSIFQVNSFQKTTLPSK